MNIWEHKRLEDCKATGEKNIIGMVAKDEPNSGLKENIIRMMQSPNFAHSAVGVGLTEEQATNFMWKARKNPLYAEYSEQMREVKKMNEFYADLKKLEELQGVVNATLQN